MAHVPPTSISHGAEDVLGHVQNAVGGLSVASDGSGAAGVLLDVLEQVVEGVRDPGGGHAHLLEQPLVAGGALRRLHAAFHRLGHQLAGFDQLLLADRRADGRGHHLRRGQRSDAAASEAAGAGGPLTRVQATS